jgi:hypothetical protein
MKFCFEPLLKTEVVLLTVLSFLPNGLADPKTLNEALLVVVLSLAGVLAGVDVVDVLVSSMFFPTLIEAVIA